MALTLLSLPNELIHGVIEELALRDDIYSFAKTNHRLFQVGVSHLYKFNAQHERCSAFAWSAEKGFESNVRRYLGHSKTLVPSRAAIRDALEAASCHGHESIVKLLIESRAIETRGCSFIPIATIKGHLGVVKLYLDYHPDLAITHDADGCTVLHRAAEFGHLDIVKMLLGMERVDLLARGQQGNTALHYAVNRGYNEIVQLLMEHGADVNVADEKGLTPVMIAAARRNITLLLRLLKQGVDINRKTNAGATALTYAACQGSSQAVEILLAHGADPNIGEDSEGNAPLLRAANQGHYSIVRMFLESGADTEICNRLKWRPLHCAAEKGHFEVAKILVQTGAELNAETRGGSTPLFYAGCRGDTSIVRLLLEAGAEVKPRHANATPILVGIANNSWHKEGVVEVVKLLLEHGVNIAQPETRFFGHTALHKAVRHTGGMIMAELLLDSGADVNAADDAGKTPLHLAVRHDTSSVELLLDRGADLNATDNTGLTPLHIAGSFGAIQSANALMQRGASCSATSHAGITPLTTAICQKHTALVESMIEQQGISTLKDATESNMIHVAARYGNTDILELLLRSGVTDISSRDTEGWTPVLHAVVHAKHNDLGMVELLLRHGADLETGTTHLASPLVAAVIMRETETAKLLLQQGANVNTRGSNEGRDTPLYAAAMYGSLDMANFLLENGADVNLAARGGWTPLQIATSKGHFDMVELLLSAGADSRADKNLSTPLNHLGGNSFGGVSVYDKEYEVTRFYGY
jgi:ankyrin repeat protein